MIGSGRIRPDPPFLDRDQSRLLVNDRPEEQCSTRQGLASPGHRPPQIRERLQEAAIKSRCDLHGLAHRLLRTNVRLEVDSPFQAKAIQRLEAPGCGLRRGSSRRIRGRDALSDSRGVACWSPVKVLHAPLSPGADQAHVTGRAQQRWGPPASRLVSALTKGLRPLLPKRTARAPP